MRLYFVFLDHEARTQLRSLRFFVIAAAFVALSLVPPIAFFIIARRPHVFVSDGTFAASTFFFEPLLAALLSAILAIDGISRERDENSFRVVSLAPLTNAGYLTYRWLAIETIAIAITILPPIGSWLLASVTHDRPAAAGLFLWPWLLKIVPLSLTVSALAIAFGTIMGSMVPAVIAAVFVFGVSFGFVNNILLRFGRVITGPVEWLGLDQLEIAFQIFNTGRGFHFGASDAAHDVAAALTDHFHSGAIFLGYSALFFGLAIAFLRRTRPNVRPWRIRADHPLRTYMKLFNRWREELTPDPKLSLTDRLVLAAGGLLFIGMLGNAVHLDDRFRALARVRYDAEMSNLPEPTPPSIVPVRWKVRGRIIPGERRIETITEATFRNDGTAAETHIGFMIDPLLDVVKIEGARFEKRWDRLSIELESPLATGETRTIRIALGGAPGEIDFPFRDWGSFVEQFRFHVIRGEMPLSFAECRIAHAIERARFDLSASSITLVPRYASWKLISGDNSESDRWFVSPETYFPFVDIDVELEVPKQYFVADGCGSSRPRGSSVPLRSRCSVALGEYSMYGGELTSSKASSGILFASLPAHTELAAAKAAAIGEASEMANRAWPGIDPLRGAIVVEISPPHHIDRFGAMMAQNWYETSGTAGKLFRLLEAEINLSEMAAPESIAANALAGELLRQRAVAYDQTAFFRYFYRAIARERLGRRRHQGATVGPDGANDEPIVNDHQWFGRVYAERLPAVAADIENRVGTRQFNAAIERFINTPSPRPATARELLAEIERDSGVSLERMWQDYFIGRAVPQLTFEDVVFDKHADGWRVSGKLRNKGTGEVLCPVVLHTDFEPAQSIVRVDSKEARPFTLETPYHPRTLQLDPENVCYRFARIGLIDRVEYEGGS